MTVATLQPRSPIPIVRADARRLEARWGLLPWKDLHFLGKEIIRICSSISGQDETEFDADEFVFIEKTSGWAGLDIRHIGHLAIQPNQVKIIHNAIATFLNNVTRKKDAQTQDLLLELTENGVEQNEALKSATHLFLGNHGGKRISSPILITHGETKSEFAGNFAPKPPTSLSTKGERDLIARIDTICFFNRWISVRPEQGTVETLYFIVEEFLDILHVGQKNQHFFELHVIDQIDARGKPISTLKSIFAIEKNALHLSN